MEPQVGKICGRFQLGAPSWKVLRKISTWGPKLKSSAEDFNLGPQVEKFCGRFQLGAPCWKVLRKISTWGPKLKSSAEDFNLGPQVGKFCGRFQLGALIVTELLQSELLFGPIA